MAPGDATGQGGSAATRFVMRFVGSIHHAIYRLSNGKVGGNLGRLPVLLLTTIGRKSGRPRTRPLVYTRDGETLIIIASAGGEPTHPAWYVNLRANPEVTVQVGGKSVAMRAATATGAERARLWAKMVAVFPGFAGYQRKTTREIPVVILTQAATSQ